jgi:hypothetical protein
VPLDLAATVARFGLPTGEREQVSVEHEHWVAGRGTVEHDRLTGLACAAVASGAMVLDPDDEADLAAMDLELQQRAVRAERLTLQLVERLRELHVPCRVLKGPTVAHRSYGDPALRPFRDVDLLVPSSALDRVVGALLADGATRPVPEVRHGFDRRFAKSVTLRHPDEVEIDLHRTLCPGPLAHLVPEADLWEAADEVAIVPGRAVPAFPADLSFLHACLHAATGGGIGWLALRDITAVAPGADLERCAATARRWRATAAVARGVAMAAERSLLPDELSAWGAALQPTEDEQRVAEVYRVRAGTSRRQLVAALRYVGGPRAKVAYAAALLFPSGEHRRARGITTRSLLARVVDGRR